MSRFAAPALFVLVLATACVEPETVGPTDDGEGPIPASVVEDDDGNTIEEVAAEDVEGGAEDGVAPLIGSLGRRRVCVYEGYDKTGRASCWYAAAGRGTCRTVNRITLADYCGAAGCVRDNSVNSIWVYSDTLGIVAAIYDGIYLRGDRFRYSVLGGNHYTNLKTSSSVKINETSSMQLCNY